MKAGLARSKRELLVPYKVRQSDATEVPLLGLVKK